MARRRSAPQIVATAGDLLVQRDAARPTGRLLRQGDMDASYVDLADPRHLEFDYLRRLRDLVEALDARPSASRTRNPGARRSPRWARARSSTVPSTSTTT